MPRTPDTSPQTLRVFGALLDDPQGWHYGYGLSKQTGLAPGTLYPILARLVDRELLETRWEASDQPGRPPRHLYRLTADGRQLAESRLAARRSPAARATGDRQGTPRIAPAPRTAS
jgi:PadR family transcriptional regulator, regulatory protein PadR